MPKNHQPGQLHFGTGLKFDLFCVASSNLDVVYVYGLPKGYWQKGKAAHEVLSMVDPVLLQHGAATPPTCRTEQLSFTCDNCGGQIKNRRGF